MKQIRLNAFDMNCATHQAPGLWRHPRDNSTEYTSLDYWQTLARKLEGGLFDGIFLADVSGIYDIYGAGPETALRHGVQFPANDPFALVPAMASVTEHLGFGVTGSLSYEQPFTFARKMSTLDHLTKGRVGWNIVTGYLESAARALGMSAQTTHDQRYDIADEYMEVVYKLWEGSWADDAVKLDRVNNIYTDPNRVRSIDHDGQYYKLNGIHMCEPSPQRTPVLYQAGGSARGKLFAGSHAECVFTGSPTKTVLKPMIAGLRAAAEQAGRPRDSIVVFQMLTVIVGRTDAEAREKMEEYKKYVSYEGALTLMSGWTGIDFSEFKPTDEVYHASKNAIQSAIERFTVADPNRVWTVQEVAEHIGLGGASPIVVGSPQTVADELMSWIEETDCDGFNLTYTVAPESIDDFIELVVPELQARGVYKTEYAPGTLREKIFGEGPRIQSPHPAASYRFFK